MKYTCRIKRYVMIHDSYEVEAPDSDAAWDIADERTENAEINIGHEDFNILQHEIDVEIA